MKVRASSKGHSDLHTASKTGRNRSAAAAAAAAAAVCQFLHGHGIVYGNLKPAAVLVDALGLLKLSDFSLAWRAAPRPLAPSPRRLIHLLEEGGGRCRYFIPER